MSQTDFCEPFFDYMRRSVQLDFEVMQQIAENSKEIIFPKGHIILEEGTSSDKVYFLVSGYARSFYTDFIGKTIIWHFI